MIAKKWTEPVKQIQKSQLSPDPVAGAPISLKAFLIPFVLLMLCALDGLELRAQQPAPGVQQPPADPCVLQPGSAPAPKPPENVEGFTKAALAAEWKSPDQVEHVLNAFQLLTTHSPVVDLDGRALKELQWAANPDLDGLYRAAMGDPDDSGQPIVQGLPSFVDALAKANGLRLEKPEDEKGLFDCTKKLIQVVFSNTSDLTPFLGGTKHPKVEGEKVPGPVMLERIYSSYKSAGPDAFLYLLLDSFPKPDTTAAQKQMYADSLEKLRAAFEMDTDGLVKQVAALITTPKQ
jgi:hypothetical protein